MADSPRERESGEERQPLSDSVKRRAERKLQANKKGERTIWFGLGLFGLIGWSVAIPTLIGIAIGVWLDSRFPGPVSWTLTFLIIGVALGCLNAWYWVKQESRRD